MPEIQIRAGAELIQDIKSRRNIKWVKKHSDFTATACPGRYFDFAGVTQNIIIENNNNEEEEDMHLYKNEQRTTTVYETSACEKEIGSLEAGEQFSAMPAPNGTYLAVYEVNGRAGVQKCGYVKWNGQNLIK